ncbi:MAG: hypothetical protein ACLR4Z_01045 [Butyricicoccaceae bacterium]
MLTMLGAQICRSWRVGCAEVLAGRQRCSAGRPSCARGWDRARASRTPVGMNRRDVQRVLTLESGQVMLVLRRENMMLLACTGDPEKLLGVSYAALRDNIANLNAAFSDKSRCYAVWKKYMAWDGREMFDEAVQSGDGRWMRFIVRRTPDGEYDLLVASRHHCTARPHRGIRKAPREGRRREPRENNLPLAYVARVRTR